MIAVAVYRIQDDEGRGPFRPGFSKTWVKERADHENLIPWYDEFGPVHNNVLSGAWSGCGCLSKKQLRRWFTKPEYRKLKKHGYRAVKMKVGRVLAESEIQCFFSRSKPLSEDVESFKLY